MLFLCEGVFKSKCCAPYIKYITNISSQQVCFKTSFWSLGYVYGNSFDCTDSSSFPFLPCHFPWQNSEQNSGLPEDLIPHLWGVLSQLWVSQSTIKACGSYSFTAFLSSGPLASHIDKVDSSWNMHVLTVEWIRTLRMCMALIRVHIQYVIQIKFGMWTHSICINFCLVHL